MKKNETVTYNSVEGLEKEYTIQEDGEVFFTGLSLGTYQIEEIASNLYYKNSTSFVGTFEVTATDMNSTIKFNKENLDHHKNNMTCVKGNICTKGVTNKRIDTASVTFKKVDADTDTELKNVVYDLYQLQKDVYDQNVYVKVMQGLKTGQKYNFDNSNS